MNASAVLSLLSAAVAFTSKETGTGGKPSVGVSELLISPWKSTVNYFSSSVPIRRFHLQRTSFLALVIAGMSIQGVYRRQVHGWTAKHFASAGLVAQLAELVAPLGCLPMMKRFGLLRTALWGERLHALGMLVEMLAPTRWLPITTLISAARYDMASGLSEIAYWRSQAGVSYLESSAAVGNLIKLVSTVVPLLIQRLYARSRPAVVFGGLVLLNLLHSEVMLPRFWPNSEAAKARQPTDQKDTLKT